MTILDRTDAPRKLASVGVPPALIEMRLLDEAGATFAPERSARSVGRGPP